MLALRNDGQVSFDIGVSLAGGSGTGFYFSDTSQGPVPRSNVVLESAVVVAQAEQRGADHYHRQHGQGQDGMATMGFPEAESIRPLSQAEAGADWCHGARVVHGLLLVP